MFWLILCFSFPQKKPPKGREDGCKTEELEKIAGLCETDRGLCAAFCRPGDSFRIERCFRGHSQKTLVLKANVTSYGEVILKYLEPADNFTREPDEFRERVKSLLKENYRMENWIRESPETEAERRSFWTAVNSKELVFSQKYKNDKIFAPIFGECRHFYVAKKLDTLDSRTVAYFSRKGKLELALKIVDLVEKLEEKGLSYCDFKMDNLGLDENDGLIKILDADNVKFKSSIRGGEVCRKNGDCFHQWGCRSICTLFGKCQLQTSNIQYVCNSIFFHKMPSKSNGLIETPQTSGRLMNVLYQCSQPGFDDVKVVKEAIEMELQNVK